MNWINNVVRPKLSGIWRKRDMPDNLWIKCPETGQMVFHKDLEANDFVVPSSDYHMRMTAQSRLEYLFDGEEYETLETTKATTDPLKFKDERKYVDRLKDARNKTQLDDAILIGMGTLQDQPIVAAVQDFRFMGGSLGMAAGNAFIEGVDKALEQTSPFIIFAASGGARMQEGILSLMQLPRTTVAVQKLREARLPYIVVLTNPTTGGVTASYAMLGDVHIAEPGALIGFAGPRVIEQTIREQLPEGFQRSEYLRDHGMVDMVVHRHELRGVLSNLCLVLMHQPAAEKQLADKKPAEIQEPAESEQKLNTEPDPEKKAGDSPGTNSKAKPNGIADIAEPDEETETTEFKPPIPDMEEPARPAARPENGSQPPPTYDTPAVDNPDPETPATASPKNAKDTESQPDDPLRQPVAQAKPVEASRTSDQK